MAQGAIDFPSSLLRLYNLRIHAIHWLSWHERMRLDWSHVFAGGRSVMKVLSLYYLKYSKKKLGLGTIPVLDVSILLETQHGE